MKLTIKKGALRVLTEAETFLVGGGGATDSTQPGCTGTQCGTYSPECNTATENGTCTDCTNIGCATFPCDVTTADDGC